MTAEIRPFRGFRMPSLVREAIHWREEPRVLKLIAMELEFRQGAMARTLRREVQHLLFKEEVDRFDRQRPRYTQHTALRFVLRDADERIQAGVDLLKACRLPVDDGTHDRYKRIHQIRHAMFRPDHGRRAHLTGAPGSIERFRLLIDVFTRAITIVNAKGVAFGGHADYIWPRDRKAVVHEMQRALRAQRQGV